MFNKNFRDGGFLGTGGNRKQKYFRPYNVRRHSHSYDATKYYDLNLIIIGSKVALDFLTHSVATTRLNELHTIT